MQLLPGSPQSQYLFEEVCDLDLSSLYPSLIIALNLAPETFICKINIYDLKNFTSELQPDGSIKLIYENVEDQLIDKYISKDYVSIGHEYLNLPDMSTLIQATERKCA